MARSIVHVRPALDGTKQPLRGSDTRQQGANSRLNRLQATIWNINWPIKVKDIECWLLAQPLVFLLVLPTAGVLTCSPDCYQSEVESGSFMMVV